VESGSIDRHLGRDRMNHEQLFTTAVLFHDSVRSYLVEADWFYSNVVETRAYSALGRPGLSFQLAR
jgi:hypothetical protein